MTRCFVFSQGKLISQDPALDFLKMVLVDEDAQIWVDLDQPTEEETKNVLESVFNFHPLSVEDCITPSERPKVEEYDGYIFIVMHEVEYSVSEHTFRTNELNIFVGKNFLVTYHDRPLHSISATLDRILKNSATVARAPDRLTYTILDFLLDKYEPALEDLGQTFDAMEQEIIEVQAQHTISRIVDLKAQLQRLRQIINPQREVVSRMARGEFKLVRAHMLPYFRDLMDRLNRTHDLTENYRDGLNDMMNVFLNLQQVQANRVMKVLTVLATLSLPIVVVTSFYGMNFAHMPELELRYAHVYVFILSALMTGAIYWILRKMDWL